MEGKLFVVATPIGNLEDITYRAVKVLSNVDIIACEDTRVAKKLLNHFSIKDKTLISYYEPVEDKVSEKIISLLKFGNDVALITDAGTPTISDPGYRLIKKAIENNIDVVPIPGVSAVITALSVSGLPTDKFIFLGFLPNKENAKRELLKKFGILNITIVIYESPHRLLKTLHLINEIFPNSDLSIAKELTKIHERIFRGKPKEIINFLEENKDLIRGEFVIVFYPNYNEEISISEEVLLKEANLLKDKGLKTKEISKILADRFNLNKKEIYKLIVNKL